MKKGAYIAIVSGLCVVLTGAGMLFIMGYQSVGTDTAEVADTAVYEEEKETAAVIAIDDEENVPNEKAAADTIEEAIDDTEETEQETDVDLPEETEEDETAAGYVVEDEEIDAYLADSVIIGDSIVLGYRNYCTKSEEEVLKSIKFLAAGNFSAHNAFWEVSSKSVHPLYQGEQRPVWESVSLMGAKNIFICLGLNDLNIDDKTCECYQQMISNILELSPEVNINIISMTYTLKDQGVGKLNNDEIRVYNEQLQKMAAENGWGFVNIAPLLADEEGNLKAGFCSDGFLHQSPAAYEIWTQALRQYVEKVLGGETPAEIEISLNEEDEDETNEKK
ncbi:MAG: hypothetical protein K2J04_15545 [Lachnospiraceae bacterium]|nr:hypothetical protein [Lachnospiraceae bacterium]